MTSFSVIIPTYNRSALISKTIEAIINQSFKNFEVIVVDDGGNDETEAVIAALADKRFRYVKQTNTGPLIARANGCDLAQGEWIAFCDSDDLWSPDYLETLNSAKARYNANVIFTDYIVEGEVGARIQKNPNKNLINQASILQYDNHKLMDTRKLYEVLMKYQPIMISSFAIKHDFYKSIGGIMKDISVLGSEDAHLTQRACAQGTTVFIDDAQVTLGRNEQNISSNYIRNLEGGLKILEDFTERSLIPNNFFDITIESQYSHSMEVAKQYYWSRELKKSKLFLDKVPYSYSLNKIFYLKFKIIAHSLMALFFKKR